MCENCRNAPPPGPSTAATQAPSAPGDYDATRRGHRHGVPLVPFTIDGEAGQPSQLLLLRDRPLHTVVRANDEGQREAPVEIYTDKTSADAAVRQGSSGEPLDELLDAEATLRATRSARLGLFLDLTVWEDIDFGGCAWEFDTNTDISVLTDFDRASACCAWICIFSGWRRLGNEASSFIVSIGWPAFGFRDRAGSTIGWPLNGSQPSWSGLVQDLRDFGWNDRAISITLPGATYP